MSASTTAESTTTAGRRRGPIGLLLDLFSSIWLGVTLLLLLFIYSSIGSAGLPVKLNILRPDAWVPVREAFELSEFMWFHWWPFDLLIALLCINLTVATLRRIPFNVVNLGVWMIHSGIIILAIGSVWYFSTKLEGDAVIPRRQIVAKLPGHEPVTFTATPGNTQQIGFGDESYFLRVSNIAPNWELLSGDDEGKRAYKVSVSVQGPDQTFVRELIAGHPEYTEDLVRSNDGEQPFARAKNERGTPVVDDRLELSLDYDPQEHFYLHETRAVYLREVGSDRWIQRPIEWMPLFNDHVASYDSVWLPRSENPPPLDPVDDVMIPPVHPDDPLPDVTLTISEYLRYASIETRRRPGGERLDPALTLRITNERGQLQQHRLVAFDQQRSSALGGAIEFVWVDSESAVEELKSVRPPTLLIGVPGADVSFSEPLDGGISGDPAAPFIGIGDTSYAYRVTAVQDDLNIEGRSLSLAIVEITNGEQTWTRWVFDDPALTRDIAGAGDAMSAHAGDAMIDPGIEMRYQPGRRSAIRFVAGPDEDQLRMLAPGAGGTVIDQPLTIGQPTPLPGGVSFTVTSYLPRSVAETRPALVPPMQRDRNVGMMLSMARVNAPLAGEIRSLWLPYHHYAFAQPQDVLRRYTYRPTTLALPDGRRIEMIFSRQRRELPYPVALEYFGLKTHIGGFTGQVSSILDYRSLVRFRTGDGWSDPFEVHMNDPHEYAGLWFFQSQWDPPDQVRGPNDPGSAGMNYTVLGVATRHGVYVQLAGCCLAVIGMIYAFYVKPYIKRRRQQRVYAEAAASAHVAQTRAVPAPAFATSATVSQETAEEPAT